MASWFLYQIERALGGGLGHGPATDYLVVAARTPDEALAAAARPVLDGQSWSSSLGKLHAKDRVMHSWPVPEQLAALYSPDWPGIVDRDTLCRFGRTVAISGLEAVQCEVQADPPVHFGVKMYRNPGEIGATAGESRSAIWVLAVVAIAIALLWFAVQHKAG